jgi:hypothetical protein
VTPRGRRLRLRRYGSGLQQCATLELLLPLLLRSRGPAGGISITGCIPQSGAAHKGKKAGKDDDTSHTQNCLKVVVIRCLLAGPYLT